MKTILYTSSAPEPIGPYSQGVQVGSLLFLSGQIAIDPSSGLLINSTIEEETRRVMLNIQALLHQAGVDFGSVVKTSIFLKNMDQFAAVNAVYAQFFSDQPPARETVEVSRLPRDVNVEISCIVGLPAA